MDDSRESLPVRCELDGDRMFTVWIDSPGKSVNTLSAAVWAGLESAVERIEAAAPAGVVIASAKPRSFIAGADLFELDALSDVAIDEHLAHGQRILNRIEALPVPTVAAINGDALGGGLEVALACRFRVASDDPRARFGLPETTLGLVPGWGGTIRLPRLVGVEAALGIMVPGKSIALADAVALGLVDRIVSRDDLLATAKKVALAPPPRGDVSTTVDGGAVRDACDRFRRTTRERSGANLPAPLRLLDIVETGLTQGSAAGETAERAGLVALRRTPSTRQLMRMFFVRTAAKKKAASEACGTPRPVQSVAVIGGGTMGGGIAAACAVAGMAVHVIEASDDAAAAASERLAALSGGDGVRVAGIHDVAGRDAVATADLVIEAVVENGAVKKDVFRWLGHAARPDAVLATNTSSLGVTTLAGATANPSRVIGLHFFNPVARMPLVEVVRAVESSGDAVATGVAFATALGKTPIICRDAPGFIVNRVLFPYLREAMLMVAEGADIGALDAAARRWGMPTGPCSLVDEIGLDVVLAILSSLAAELGDRFAVVPVLATAVSRGWLGRKSGRGLYVHAPEGRPVPNPLIDEIRSARSDFIVRPGDANMEARLLPPMLFEARRVLDEKIVSSPDALDLATVLGMGFPAFRGGLATYAADP